MAIANLHETWLSLITRRNDLNLEITQLQSQKTLALREQGDVQQLLSAEKRDARDFYKHLYEEDESLQEKYIDYTKIPDFEEMLDQITAKYQDKLDELTAWETQLDAQITTDSAELQEVQAYMESIKNMLSSNIQEDFDLGGLGG